MKNKNTPHVYNTPYQLKIPLEIEKIIEISDLVYTFCEVLNQIDLKRYLVIKENRTGRKRFDSETLLQVVLFAFMEHGYVSVREIEKLCKTDIRFMWLLQEMKAPSFITIDNFMKNCLVDSMDEILSDINAYIFRKEKVDLEHIYIDGTKITANANKYSWVWKKSSIKNHDKTFHRIGALLEEINASLAPKSRNFHLFYNFHPIHTNKKPRFRFFTESRFLNTVFLQLLFYISLLLSIRFGFVSIHSISISSVISSGKCSAFSLMRLWR